MVGGDGEPPARTQTTWLQTERMDGNFISTEIAPARLPPKIFIRTSSGKGVVIFSRQPRRGGCGNRKTSRRGIELFPLRMPVLVGRIATSRDPFFQMRTQMRLDKASRYCGKILISRSNWIVGIVADQNVSDKHPVRDIITKCAMAFR